MKSLRPNRGNSPEVPGLKLFRRSDIDGDAKITYGYTRKHPAAEQSFAARWKPAACLVQRQHRAEVTSTHSGDQFVGEEELHVS
jgi:hypothetical protein